MTINRHDYPRPVRAVLDTAINWRVLTAWDLAELLDEFGSDYSAMVDRVCEIAFNDRHTNGGRDAHAAIVRAAEDFWKTP